MSFKREDRYIVLKKKDFLRYLNDRELNTLAEICNKIKQERILEGKHELRCVVIEDDWPEYEMVWKMLESRIQQETLRPTSVTKLTPIYRHVGECSQCGRRFFQDSPNPSITNWNCFYCHKSLTLVK